MSINEDHLIKLTSISEKVRDGSISLPTVQRGFVWKPHQIENLWDSLLRGYPVGSFVLSHKTNSEGNFELLDGQQRASSICLGFYGPINRRKTSTRNNIFLKTSSDNIMIFVDLAIPDSQRDNRKYLFRVITKSHPWGYRRRENQKTLESKHIVKAMKLYRLNNDDYLQTPLRHFWPYDSFKPIPLGLFLNAKNISGLKQSIEDWKKDKNLNVIDKKSKGTTSYYSIEQIFSDVKIMLDEQKLPLLWLNLSKLFDADVKGSTVSQNGDIELEASTQLPTTIDLDKDDQMNIEDRSLDEIENLFIRLNSGGTALKGEELNYSVLKSQISNTMQNEIEQACNPLFSPARFITIAFRLFNISSDIISMRIKPKQFQSAMKDRKDAFIEFMKNKFIKTKTLDNVKSILTYNENSNPNGLPSFVSYRLAHTAPEVMFMLLYRLIIREDDIKDKDIVLGMVTLFVWLGRGVKEKDHSKLLNNIWPCMKQLDAKRFWSNETVLRAIIRINDNEVLLNFPSLQQLKRALPKGDGHITKFDEKTFYKGQYGNFFRKILRNTDVLLYSQRSYLSKWFHKIEDYNLDDTNSAFDLDHICPRSYIKNKKNLRKSLKYWYNSIGNLRAWPYSLNKSDQDDAPAVKFNPKSEDKLSWWSEYLNNKELTEKLLRNYLLSASSCSKEWLDMESDIKDKIKENKVVKQVLSTIMNRNSQLCADWYNSLKIDSLIPETLKKSGIKSLFNKFLKLSMWYIEKNDDDMEYHLQTPHDSLRLYFAYNVEGYTLLNDYIGFGMFCDEDEFKNVKIPKKFEKSYIREDEYCIRTNATLISFSEDSRIDLLNEFYLWLLEFPNSPLQEIVTDKFCSSIRLKYRDRILKTN